jgi:organic radical activating enzyme
MGHDADVVVVTGGEPLLQQRALVPLLTLLNGAGMRVEVETNGTVAPDPGVTALISSFNVSPKLRSFAAQRDQLRRIQPEALRTFAESGKAVFKFVAGTHADLEEVATLAAAHELQPVWIMPEGTNAESVLENMRRIADDVLHRGWHLTTRLHVLLWGDARGR